MQCRSSFYVFINPLFHRLLMTFTCIKIKVSSIYILASGKHALKHACIALESSWLLLSRSIQKMVYSCYSWAGYIFQTEWCSKSVMLSCRGLIISSKAFLPHKEMLQVYCCSIGISMANMRSQFSSTAPEALTS